MNFSKYNLCFCFTIFLLLIKNNQCLEELIELKDLYETSQCFYLEKTSYGEREEIIYELINNNLEKTLFLQFTSVDSIYIYESVPNLSNIIFSKTKEEDNFGNYYFFVTPNIDKYYIKIELSQTEISDYKICFNLFDGKGNSFKANIENPIKTSSFDIINSGHFPFAINENINAFTALRYNKKYENFFSISSFRIKAYILDSDDIISLNIIESYEKGDYKYVIWNLDYKNTVKIKEILIEAHINIIDNEKQNNVFEMEQIDVKEIHHEYNLILKKNENHNNQIYYINLKKSLFSQDLDILFLTNHLKNEIFISNSDNINNNNVFELDKKFIIINKYLFEKEKYQTLNPYLLIIIIDESFNFENNEEIFYNFHFAGGSHELYKYNEDLTKDEFFNNKNKILIKNNLCRNNFYINYFKKEENQKIIEYEPILGNTSLFYTNRNDLSNNIEDYFLKINNFPVDNIQNSILVGDYAIFKIDCFKDAKSVLSYIYAYDKNSLDDIINFENQKILLFIEANIQYRFKFSDNLKDKKFNFRIRVLKKDEGEFNLEIKYNDDIYNTLTEDNFLELTHEKDVDYDLNIKLNVYYDLINVPKQQELIIEIIKEIDIEKNLLKLEKSNIENAILQSKKYYFFEYSQKDSSQVQITLKNENDNICDICIHKGYGVYPFLIKPICEEDDFINLSQNQEINLIFENPYLSPSAKNINNIDNPLYISIYSDNNIKFSYVYEKYSTFNINGNYKDINFNGKEIIQLENHKNFPIIYYQINLCQDINNNFQEYSFTKPIFNYYFDKKENYEVNDINSNIIKEYELHSDNPKIIFYGDGALKGKFKYIYGNKNKLNYNDNYSKKINVEQNKNFIKIAVESAFYGEITMNVIIITSDLEQYNGYCEIIDLYEKFKNNEGMSYYGEKLISKTMVIEQEHTMATMEIESNNILDFNKKKVKIFVINTLNEINVDIFYNPIITQINLNGYSNELKEKEKTSNNILIIVVVMFAFCLIFIMFRNCQNKDSNQINFERKNMRLNDGVINESNKLFI